MRPLIGVSTSEVRIAERAQPLAHADPRRRELALGIAYLEAVERAGGIPVILAPLPAEDVDDLLDNLAGLCLSGGPDIAPGAYRADPHPRLGPTEPELDAFELAVARRALLRGMPVLGICRGLQVLNVARGGTLHQHLPDVTDGSIEHRQSEPGDEPTHAVRVLGSSRLAQALGGRAAPRVNSFHHQAVHGVGDGLRPVAWSPDGVIEAIESSGPQFALGVQWHAECLTARDEQASLFGSLVRAARRRPMPARRAA